MRIVKYSQEIREIFIKDSRMCFSLYRRSNLQGTKLDHFKIKIWKARVDKICRDVFAALAYLGFHFKRKKSKYILMFSKVYWFLAGAFSLFAFAVCIGPLFKNFFPWALHCSHNGRTVLYNFFSSLSTFAPLLVQ